MFGLMADFAERLEDASDLPAVKITPRWTRPLLDSGHLVQSTTGHVHAARRRSATAARWQRETLAVKSDGGIQFERTPPRKDQKLNACQHGLIGDYGAPKREAGRNVTPATGTAADECTQRDGVVPYTRRWRQCIILVRRRIASFHCFDAQIKPVPLSAGWSTVLSVWSTGPPGCPFFGSPSLFWSLLLPDWSTRRFGCPLSRSPRLSGTGPSIFRRLSVFWSPLLPDLSPGPAEHPFVGVRPFSGTATVALKYWPVRVSLISDVRPLLPDRATNQSRCPPFFGSPRPWHANETRMIGRITGLMSSPYMTDTCWSHATGRIYGVRNVQFARVLRGWHRGFTVKSCRRTWSAGGGQRQNVDRLCGFLFTYYSAVVAGFLSTSFHVVYTRPRIRLETAAEPFRTNALPDNVVTASSVESLWHHLKAFLL